MISITDTGVKILCDGDRCHETADVPVGLHPEPQHGQPPIPSVDGWLFVANVGGEWRHYCPACQAPYLKRLREASAA